MDVDANPRVSATFQVQSIPAVYAVADRIAIVYLGRLVAQGSPAEIDRQAAIELMRIGFAAVHDGAGSATAAG